MLIIISPAKILNLKPQNVVSKYTLPDFLDKSKQVIERARELNIEDLQKLSQVNRSIAQTNYDRFYNWQTPFTPENAKQAILTFNGEVYNGLQAKTFSSEDFDYLQNHLRILSGLYGVLRPLDLMQPYRLEIGSKLNVGKTNNLYDFWGNTITEKLNEAFETSGNPKVLINLASGEYFKSVNAKLLKAKVIDIEFYEIKNDGSLKTIVVYTKKARGMMARYIIQNRIEEPEDLKGFDAEGYWFSPQLSNENKLVFTR
ncbi:MAG: peroxide stress protein YaaA [Paludibacteraceae bacterium]|nr:peroxide stress protein YaaA [Paludibacteraceae bacterium]MBN2788032.1 peroxide stress protein YaaA [Paludibacteraceae bacterium]